MVKLDNEGAIFMAWNITAMSHKRHVDIRYKYVYKCIESGIMKIVFLKSTENNSNILKKNLSGDVECTPRKWWARCLNKEQNQEILDKKEKWRKSFMIDLLIWTYYYEVVSKRMLK